MHFTDNSPWLLTAPQCGGWHWHRPLQMRKGRLKSYIHCQVTLCCRARTQIQVQKPLNHIAPLSLINEKKWDIIILFAYCLLKNLCVHDGYIYMKVCEWESNKRIWAEWLKMIMITTLVGRGYEWFLFPPWRCFLFCFFLLHIFYYDHRLLFCFEKEQHSILWLNSLKV